MMITFIKKVKQSNIIENDQGSEVSFKLVNHKKCLKEVPFELKSDNNKDSSVREFPAEGTVDADVLK